MAAGSSRLVYPAEQGYPRNQWYVAAFASEIGEGKLLLRRLLDVPVVLYRTESGEAVALYDRCPHRGLPLSMGTQVGDRIRCGYHGMEFGADGRCAHIPSQSATPASMSIPHYPVIEKWQWLWIWMGDPAKADPALLPDHDWLGLTSEGYTATPFFMMEMACNYQYLHDNLLDTSHLTYLHPGSLDTGEMAGSSFWAEEKGQLLQLGRDTPGLSFSGPIAQYFRVEEHKIYDRRLIAEAFIPSIHAAKQTIRDPADPSVPPIELYAINALTPASPRQTYVFHAQTTTYPDNCTEYDMAGVRHILWQDKVAAEALQANYDLYKDTTEMSVTSDNAGVRCRRILGRLMAEERSSVAAA
jgi:vanillate O-demethylase monooxygenase subunit